LTKIGRPFWIKLSDTSPNLTESPLYVIVCHISGYLGGVGLSRRLAMLATVEIDTIELKWFEVKLGLLTDVFRLRKENNVSQ